ncbi:hypothetical protein K443DRAFT_158983 [Laccaria amethystina LaAM-08-1]|uniref:Uncharacterized protein n=1 Tax=Laccaria amethystina LaAM-08-1 TaxID=1095629 RepID=A0A0C9WGK5_9AGAR|nr:hypothetical protein K443DRAFT_158983 [Laccaria amethystina LaAM-08-1]
MSTESNFKRFVEIWQVVLLKSGPFSGKIAVIAEIIDHNRTIIDGSTTVFLANLTPTSTSPSLPSNSLPCPEEMVRNMSAKRSRERPSLTNGTTQVGHRSSRCRRDGR